jgi:hypothetical protein
MAASYACAKSGLPCTVFLPKSTPEFAAGNIAEHGAEVIYHGYVFFSFEIMEDFFRNLFFWNHGGKLISVKFGTKRTKKRWSDWSMIQFCTFILLIIRQSGKVTRHWSTNSSSSWKARSLDYWFALSEVEDFWWECLSDCSAIIDKGLETLVNFIIDFIDFEAFFSHLSKSPNRHDVPVLAMETNGTDSLNQSFKTGELATLPAIDSIAKSLGTKSVAKEVFEAAKMHPGGVTSRVCHDTEAIQR